MKIPTTVATITQYMMQGIMLVLINLPSLPLVPVVAHTDTILFIHTIFPIASLEAEEISKTYQHIQKSGKVLNIKRNELTVMGDAEHMDAAQEAVDYMVDECDADIDDAEELTI